jgi:hypothetical protein
MMHADPKEHIKFMAGHAAFCKSHDPNSNEVFAFSFTGKKA